jgi:ribosome-associated protein
MNIEIQAALRGPLEFEDEERNKIEAKELAIQTAQIAGSRKGQHIVVLDVRDISNVTDFFVIASADNRVQLKAMTDDTLKQVREKGVQRHHVEGYNESGWWLIDFGSVVAHYFLEDRREFFGLERLWGDAPRVDFEAESRTGNADPTQVKEG